MDMTTKTKSRRTIIPQSMIPALRDGRKTQHRVPVKRKIGKGEYIAFNPVLGWNVWRGDPLNGDRDPIECPFKVGDELWVAESMWSYEHTGWTRGGALAWPRLASPDRASRWLDDALEYVADNPSGVGNPVGRLSAITMPRWASRFVLTVTDVGVERVQDISEAGAVAEGITNHAVTQYWNPSRGAEMQPHQHGFMLWWDRIHGPGAWDRNDWVWVPTFTTKETTR